MLAVRTPLPSLAYLSRFAARPTTDAELLGRFVADRDEDAFAELVRQHGPTILAVCRRVTRNRDDADDAFQATFLALARKASQVRPGSGLGGWLYGSLGARAPYAAASIGMVLAFVLAMRLRKAEGGA